MAAIAVPSSQTPTNPQQPTLQAQIDELNRRLTILERTLKP